MSARVCAVAVILVLALSLPNAFAQLEGGEHHPGDELDVDIYCANNSEYDVKLQAKVEDNGGLGVTAIGSDKGPVWVSPGKGVHRSFIVDVPEDAAPGTCTVTFECTAIYGTLPEVRQKYVVKVVPAPKPWEGGAESPFRRFLDWLYDFFALHTFIDWFYEGILDTCVIATAAYGSEMAPEVVYMRYVRDSLIGSTWTGRILVAAFDAFYYLWSPTVASAIANSELLRAVFRVILLPLVAIVHATAIVFTSTKNVVGTADVASVVAFVAAAIMTIAVYVVLPLFGGVKLVQVIRRRPLYKPSIVSRGYSANPEDQGLFCYNRKTFVSLDEEDENFDD